jgi:hypothetical protein
MSYHGRQHRYQLIAPIIGNKIYETKSLKKGSDKCYRELKASGPITSNEFVVMDIDTYTKYPYAIDKENKILLGGGGATAVKAKGVPAEVTRPAVTTVVTVDSKILKLEQKFNSLDNQIKEIKQIIIENGKTPKTGTGVINPFTKEPIIEQGGASPSPNPVNKDVVVDVNADKLPTSRPKIIHQNQTINLPTNVGSSFVNNENTRPSNIKLSSHDIYRTNIKKLSSANAIEKDEDENYNGCIIM